ncbi:hypothetical protein F5884DRAFT_361248 [Xylogone sp. PMI_703]|nr:hypothetical protein F5884DRAFT_361248 [Xylogone sp. PMI_703]
MLFAGAFLSALLLYPYGRRAQGNQAEAIAADSHSTGDDYYGNHEPQGTMTAFPGFNFLIAAHAKPCDSGPHFPATSTT